MIQPRFSFEDLQARSIQNIREAAQRAVDEAMYFRAWMPPPEGEAAMWEKIADSAEEAIRVADARLKAGRGNRKQRRAAAAQQRRK